MLVRVSTNNNHNLTIDAFQRRQATLADTQRQISSGQKYDNFGDISKDGQMRRVVDFNSSLDQINTFHRNNLLLASRLEAMDKSLDAITSINTKVITAMVQERSAVGVDNPLTQQLRAYLQQVEDHLNVNTDGRYLFAGAASSSPPVGNLLIPNLDTDDSLIDNYYSGDGAVLSQKVSKDVDIQYNFRANDPAFQKLIGAMHMAIKAEANKDDAGIAAAIDLANEAQKEIVAMRSTINSNAVTIEQVEAQHDNFKLYYRNTLEEVSGTDVAEASIRLSLDQAVLTASFQAFARVSSLTLSDYLR